MYMEVTDSELLATVYTVNCWKGTVYDLIFLGWGERRIEQECVFFVFVNRNVSSSKC